MANQYKVLIVDDNENIRELYKESLTAEGYQTLTAKDANEALELFKNENPHIVTLDIKMPDVNGLEILSTMKSINKKTPVILYSAYGNYKQDYISWAADAFLIKSSDLTELKQKIKELLMKKETNNNVRTKKGSCIR